MIYHHEFHFQVLFPLSLVHLYKVFQLSTMESLSLLSNQNLNATIHSNVLLIDQVQQRQRCDGTNMGKWATRAT